MTGNETIVTVPDELTYIAVEARENPKVTYSQYRTLRMRA